MGFSVVNVWDNIFRWEFRQNLLVSLRRPTFAFVCFSSEHRVISLCFKSGLPHSSVLSKIEWARGFDGYFRLEIWLKWCKAQVFCSFTLRNATHVFRCLFALLFSWRLFRNFFALAFVFSPHCSLAFSSSFSKFCFCKMKNFFLCPRFLPFPRAIFSVWEAGRKPIWESLHWCLYFLPLFFSKFFFHVLKFLAYCLSLGPFSRQRVLFLQQNLRLQCDRCNFMNVMFQDRYHSSCFIFWRLLSRNFQSFSSYYHFLRCFSFPL